MSAFAVLRDSADLRRACEELSALLALRLQLAPDTPAAALLGLWVDAELATALPLTLALRDGLPGAGIRIRETHSCGEVWTLCWLDATAHAVADAALPREALLAALRQAPRTASGASASHGVFIPVFGAEADPGAVEAELQQLQGIHPHCVTSPLFQDPRTGRLSPRALP